MFCPGGWGLGQYHWQWTHLKRSKKINPKIKCIQKKKKTLTTIIYDST